MSYPTVSNVIANPSFEDGDTGWSTKGTGWVIIQFGNSYDGSWAASNGSSTGGTHNAEMLNDNVVPVVAGKVITLTGYARGSGADGNQGAVFIEWQDGSNTRISTSVGNLSDVGSSGTWFKSEIKGTAPAGAVYARAGVYAKIVDAGGVQVDALTWDYVYDRTATLSSPQTGATYTVGDSVLLAVDITGTQPAVTQVQYFESATLLATSTTPGYSFNLTTLTAGSHTIHAVVTFADTTTITTNSATITVAPVPPVVVTREYKASNAYTYLVAQNFFNISSSVPSVARVTGVAITVDYSLQLLVRSKDIGVTDPAGANPNVVFDITDGANIEATLLSDSGNIFTPEGSPIVSHIPMDLTDFTISETATSDNKKWTVFNSTGLTTTIGGANSLFGLTDVAAPDFVSRAIGFRFLPVLLPKPSYADSGDMCIRFFVNKIRLSVYFTAGSADYYFASPDKTKCIKGTLVASYVTSGDFRTADATGELQLQPDLTVMTGTQTWVGDDWTIHAAFPPTDANQIGLVDLRDAADGVGLSYNGLPSADAITANRSRYNFITTNFFAVKSLNSIYGCHGLPRAFAYNTNFFYRIFTQPDASKDQPRHVANHHGHLALGFDDGRVDLSVSGKPYSYDGTLGASEWAIGDAVTGLLALPGTILGVFGSKSIWGISGTTVDNFATQVITPNIGAVEYTVVNVGYPVYANAYGIYTLSQTQAYGDYEGTPMSQDISPWLRPRLIRRYTSNREVVCAWPVRTKNQYKLAFSDGYVLSMTLNINRIPGMTYTMQGDTPTFSFQKYFITVPNTDPVLPRSLYDYPSVVPIAISSQIDEAGQERVHMAPSPGSFNLPPPGGSTALFIAGNVPDAFVGDTASYDYTSAGGTSPRTFSIVGGTLPTGVTMNSSGHVSGVFDLAGSYTWTVRVTDSTGAFKDLNDGSVVSPMTISGDLPNHAYGDVVSYTYISAHGVGAKTFSILSGALPTGLSMDSSGVVTGTCTYPGTFTWVVRVTDSFGNTADLNDTCVVSIPAVVISGTPPQGQVGVFYTFTWTCSGGTNTGFVWSLDSGTIPSGLSFGPLSGSSLTISGTPTVGGTFDFVLRATDSIGTTTTANEEIPVITVLYMFGGANGNVDTTEDFSTWNEYDVGVNDTVLGLTKSGSNHIAVTDNDGTGSTSHAFTSNNNGATWVERTIPDNTSGIYGVAAGLSKVLCVTRPGGSTDGKVFLSLDDGQTWSDETIPSGAGPLTSVEFNGTIFVITSSTGFILTYDGSGYSKYSAGTNELAGCFSTSDNAWMVVGDEAETYTAPANGHPWTFQSNQGGSSYSFFAVTAGDTAGEYAAGANGNSTTPGCYRTTNQGATWSQTLTSDIIFALRHFNGLYIAGGDNQVHVAPDAASWVSHPLPNSYQIHCIYVGTV